MTISYEEHFRQKL